MTTDASNRPKLGKVFLVGAGPGDPELLTLKAYRVLQAAEVVLYDRLVSPEIMTLLPESATQVYVGKRRADHSVPQTDIGQLLVDYALKGKFTVRLKGGDPFIFGRGGEELEQLAAAEIPFEVIPGITAASGCAASAGIPLTHRDYSQSVRFITGHLQDGSINLDWEALRSPNQTLVFYMGLVGLTTIAATMISMGRSPDTPLAVIEKGTTPQEKIHISSLANVEDLLATTVISAPTLIIIGDVVKLHALLAKS
ncbi:uroporphyrinogen-III C-methyltransferase [Halioxenophilus sp. WMMB6]|uniref:uroporphyrinogen-III C-methyltransferase n=1 Tax=Halioxenophilus sp. WMMB6 TaxID=3073815 RepID=UPI00295ECF0B|nr:uroporphyrinogen-III C-methyltransferase [Halioxenophilus sp. WMMB6]